MFLFNRHPHENPNNQPEEQPEIIDEKEQLKMRGELEKEFEEVGIEIEQPKRFPDLPINFEVFDEKFRDCLKKCCNEFWYYLKLPFVWDNFGNDYKTREVWRKSIEDKYGKMFPKKIAMLTENKLCHSKIQALLIAVGKMKDELNKLNDEQCEDLLKIFKTAENEMGDIALGYPNRDIDEKELEIKRIEDITYDILKATFEFSKK